MIGDWALGGVAAAVGGEPAVADVVQRLAWLLLAAALLGIAARRVGVPYAVALLLGGLLVEESHALAVPSLDPDVLLFVFLPPLLFDAAFRLDAREVRAVARPMLLLAVPGVLLAAAVVGVVLWAAIGLPLPVALLFGSLVAATDPVAVVGVFRELRVSPRLALVAEGESLVNDGMAITLYVVLLGWATTGAFNAGAGLATFALEVLGGVGIGVALGVVSSRLTALTDDHLVEMLLSVSVAYGSYLAADAIGASGALACVAAGFVHGSYGRAVGMSATTRRLLDDLWEFIGFLANALVFLLLGFSVRVGDLMANPGPVAVAVVAVFGARVLVTGLTAVVSPQRDGSRPWREAVLLTWGGLRGALTAALALALPMATPARATLTAMAFGVVLFTLVVQGLSLPWVIRRLGLTAPP